MSYRSTYEEAPARARLEAEAADIEDDSYDVADHLARTVDRTHLSDSPGSDSGHYTPTGYDAYDGQTRGAAHGDAGPDNYTVSTSSHYRDPRTADAASTHHDGAHEGGVHEEYVYDEDDLYDETQGYDEYDQYDLRGAEYDHGEYAEVDQDELAPLESFEPTAVNPEDWDPKFHLHPGYQVHDGADWTVGSIVMVYWAEPRGQSSPKGKKGGTSRYTLTEMVHQSFRRMVVVKSENGQSFCCPISTYGGQGCQKKRCKPERHSIIHDEGSKPRSLKDERKLGFPPVKATMYDDHTLSPASRLNYGNAFWVQHNLPVMFVGRVSTDAMKRVKSAYKRFILESEDEMAGAPSSSKSRSKHEAMDVDWNETKKGKKKTDGESSSSHHTKSRRSRR